jgi:hypothetical protein
LAVALQYIILLVGIFPPIGWKFQKIDGYVAAFERNHVAHLVSKALPGRCVLCGVKYHA